MIVTSAGFATWFCAACSTSCATSIGGTPDPSTIAGSACAVAVSVNSSAFCRDDSVCAPISITTTTAPISGRTIAVSIPVVRFVSFLTFMTRARFTDFANFTDLSTNAGPLMRLDFLWRIDFFTGIDVLLAETARSLDRHRKPDAHAWNFHTGP